MPNDDEIVSEGITLDLPHESHGDLSFDVAAAHAEARERLDTAAAQVAFERDIDDFEFGQASMSEIAAINNPTPTEPTPTDGLPPNLQAIYPRLSIVEEADPQHPEQGTGDIDFDFFVYIVAFQESFKARWTEGERSYGRLNPMYYYGGTNRTAEISFTLPASTVRESRNNLNNCSQLSRAVYGRYRKWNEGKDFTMLGHRYFRVNFGSLIRNERLFINAFAFTVNQDAGVFDYDGSVVGSDGNPIDTDVTHSTKGLLLPKQVDVKMSIIFKHDYPLGFGGPLIASNDRTTWAPNNGKDFPHGTGNHPLQPYMNSVATPQQVAASENLDILQDIDQLLADSNLPAETRSALEAQRQSILAENPSHVPES